MSSNAWSNIRTTAICLAIFGGSLAWWVHIAREDEAKKEAAAEAKAQEEFNKRYPVRGRYVDMGDGPHEPFKSPPAGGIEGRGTSSLPGESKPGVERERPRIRIGRAED